MTEDVLQECSASAHLEIQTKCQEGLVKIISSTNFFVNMNLNGRRNNKSITIFYTKIQIQVMTIMVPLPLNYITTWPGYVERDDALAEHKCLLDPQREAIPRNNNRFSKSQLCPPNLHCPNPQLLCWSYECLVCSITSSRHLTAPKQS